MERDTVIALAKKTDLWQILETYSGEFGDGFVEADCLPDLERFAALVEEHMKSQGYRQCAQGQRTTQFCGMLEQAMKDEREACAQIAEEWLGPTKDRELHIAATIRSRE